MILREIIEIEGKIELLVAEKGGLVDEPQLMFEYFLDIEAETSRESRSRPSLLTSLIIHFRVIKEVQRYQDFVYPREINEVLREKFESLHKELNKLSK